MFVRTGTAFRHEKRKSATSPLAFRANRVRLPFDNYVLEDYIAAVEAAEARRNRLIAQIQATLPDWTLRVVRAI